MSMSSKIKKLVGFLQSRAVSKACASLFMLFALFAFSPAVQAACEYRITNTWPNNFQANITVTNPATASGPTSGWQVDWTYPDGSFIYNFYNANVTGSYSASNLSWNGTLQPGQSFTFGVQGNGNGVASELTGAICGPAVISQNLTIVKEVVNDNGGSATANDFGITTSEGIPTFSNTSTNGSVTTYTSDPISIATAGIVNLSEIDHPDYNEGTWSCSSASGALTTTFNAGSVEIAEGENVTCTIRNDDIPVTLTLPTEVTPAVCAIDPATRFYMRAASWTGNGGNQIGASGVNGAIFSRAEDFVAGPGITFNTSSTTAIITGADQSNFAAAYQAGDYIEYEVETNGSLANTQVLSGFSENGGRNGTAPYQMDMLMSDDNFASAVRIFSNFTVDGNNDPNTGSTFSWITNIQQAYLDSGTEYKFRLVFYAASPSNRDIMMDDFAISVDQCTDRGDAPYSGGNANTGGHFLPSVRSHFIGGLSPDAEFFVPNDDNTNGDITAGEEAGVVIPTFMIGQPATITVPVTGFGGMLNAWIDWDGNQVFDADERIATNTPIPGGGTSGTITLNVTPNADAVVGSTYARFRWSPNNVSNPTDFVAVGELEDYPLEIIDSTSLTIVKMITSDNGGVATVDDFNISVNGTEVDWDNPTSTTGDTKLQTTTPGTYALTEATIAGYTNGTFSCTGAADTNVSDGNITVVAGETVECTVINTDDETSLTIEKIITSDNGGTATVDDFDISIDGTEVDWANPTSTTADTKLHTTIAGTYALSEATVTGYTNGTFSCTGGADTDVSDGNITVALGETVVCSVTNTDDETSLTINKTIISDDGVDATLADFNLAVNGVAVPWSNLASTTGGSAVATTSAGTYTLSEIDFGTYSEGIWKCADDVTGNSVNVTNGGAFDGADVVVTLGQAVTCSITNDDINPFIPSITVVKTIASDNGGTATLSDFNITYDGIPVPWATPTSTIGGSELVTRDLGTYTLSENNVAGYTAGTWSCRDQDGATVPVSNSGLFSGSAITLEDGKALICSITNSDDPASLTLVKALDFDNGGTATIADFPLAANGNIFVSGVAQNVNAGTYALTETNLAAYTGSDYSCEINGGSAVVGNSVTLGIGDNAVCTITNTDDETSLTLVKTIASDNGGTATVDDFDISVNGTEVDWANPTSTTGDTKLHTTIAGTYQLTEATVAGYTNGVFSCTGAADTNVSDGITVAIGEVVICSVENTDDPASLTLVKVVDNNNGGMAGVADFDLFANGTSFTSGTAQTVNADTYTLTESALDGYTGGDYSCVINGAAPVVGNSVVLALGDNAVCTVTNTDNDTSLTIVKTITSDNNGTATVDDFNISVDGVEVDWANPTSTTGDTKIHTTIAGTYQLAEASVTGYTNGTFSCIGGADTDISDGITVTLGEEVTCSVTNTDDPASLSLVKVVDNDNGGTAVIADFDLFANGTSFTSGTAQVVNADTYALTESTLTGYTGGDYSCVINGAAPVVSNSVTLALGDNAVCTVTNTDNDTSLTIVKTITSDNGGTATVDDFDISVDGVEVDWGYFASTTGGTALHTTLAGTYQLTEAAVAGYTNGTFSCTGAADTDVSDGNITIALGEEVVCSVTNNDNETSLTINKIIISDNDVVAKLADFNVAVNSVEVPWSNPSSTTGGIQVAATTAGTYTLSEVDFGTYTEGTWSCVDDATSNPVSITNSGAFNGADVVVALGQSVTCEITNDDIDPFLPSLTVVKTISSDNGGTKTLANFGVSVNGTEVAWTNSTSTLGGSEVVVNGIGTAGDYILSESDVAGYTEGTWSCRDQDGLDVAVSNSGIFSGATVSLAADQALICSITNEDEPASLSLVKVVENDNGGTAKIEDFELFADTTLFTSNEAQLVNAGSYALTESSLPLYTGSGYSCVINGGAPVVSNTLTVDNGDTAICTVTNTDDDTSLTIVKNIVSDNGGTATVGDFNVSVDGTEVDWGNPTSTTSDTKLHTIVAGTYSLSEGSVTAYTNGDFSCTGSADEDLSDGNITVALGEHVICSVTNTDDDTSLTVLKKITSNHGGIATLGDFDISVNGTEIAWTNPASTTSGTEQVATKAGTYTLTEGTVSGFTNGEFVCVGGADTDASDGEITVALGEAIVCSVNNTDDDTSLTIVKTIISDNGGTATLDDFDISVDGIEVNWSNPNSTTGGTYLQSTIVGTYVLSEGTVPGYTNGRFSCSGNSDTDLSDGITLALGEVVVCSVENTDDPTSLTIVKTITSDNGGTATVDDFDISVNGTEVDWVNPTSPTGDTKLHTTLSGTYVLTEETVAGYTNGTFICSGNSDTNLSDGLTVALGENVICSVTNTDNDTSLTIVKTITSDNGGTATVDDFDISVNGTEVDWANPTSPTGDTKLHTTVAGTYQLTEAAVAGYTNGIFSCSGGADTDASDGITVVLGEAVVCSVENTDNLTSLTIVKTITSDNAGTATVDDFDISVNGSEVDWANPTSTTGDTKLHTTLAGTYALTEATVAGYTNGAFSCTGAADTNVGDGITVALGENVICSVTNTDNDTSLTIVKTITSDNGGTATVGDFDISVDGTEVDWTNSTSTTGDTKLHTTRAGTYQLTEAIVAGYTNGTFSCVGAVDTNVSDGITVALGEAVTCSVENTDDPVNLTLVKVVENTNGGTAVVADFDLFANGTNFTSATAQTVNAGTYALTESTLAGYTGGDYSCIINDAIPVIGNSVTLALGDNAVCTVTNKDNDTSLTIVKTITSDNGGTATVDDFNISVDGTEVDWTNPTSTTGDTKLHSTLAGTYTLSEATVAGYTNGTFNCTGAADTNISDGIEVALGEAVVCSVENTDNQTSLTIVKTITSDNGGTASVDDFDISVNGTEVDWANSASTTGDAKVHTTLAGIYQLTEATVAGYTNGTFSCVGAIDTNVSDGITVALGETVTCSVENTDDPANLTLVKVVENTNGGTAIDTDFDLFANGTSFTTNTAQTVSAGTYALTESTLAGYSGGDYSCVINDATPVVGNSVTLALGDNAVCTVINTDSDTSLTIVKTIVSDNGGTASVDDFNISVNGTEVDWTNPTSPTGDTKVHTTLAGTYQLSEATVAGYTNGTFSCTGAADTDASDGITVALGEAVICSVENTDDPASLTLVKVVENTNGGTAIDTDFDLFANGTSFSTNTAQTVNAGTYALTESTLAGYTNGDYSCAINDAAPVVGNSVILGLGDKAICTVTNTDSDTSLTIVKTIVSDNGGTATVGDFDISVDGTEVDWANPTSPTGDTKVHTTLAGTYQLTEATLAGYTNGTFSCSGAADTNVSDGITLALGEAVICSVENTDDPTSLTIVKTITSDNGGTAIVGDFDISVDDTEVDWTNPTSTTGDTHLHTTIAGTYQLTEATVAGYTNGTFSCTGAADTDASDGITVALGEAVICSVENTDDPASLTLVKVVENTNGGTAEIADFDLFANGESFISNTAQIVNAGAYALTESTLAGYSGGDYSCVINDAVAVVGNSVTLALGDNAVCTVTNTDNDTSLTIVKTITSDNGGTATVDDFDISVNGTEVDWTNPTSTTGDTKLHTTLAGTYTLTEATLAGYTNGTFSCTGAEDTDASDGITVAIGEAVICSVTNIQDEIPSISLAKSASNIKLNANGTFNVDYTLIVKNTGTINLSPLSLVDDLQSQFNGALVSIVNLPVVTNFGSQSANTVLPTANSSFDGINSTNLILGNDGDLAVDDSYKLVFTAQINPNASGAPQVFANQAQAGGLSGGISVTDLSDDENEPDANNDDDPTLVQPPQPNPELQSTKFAGTPVLNPDLTFNMPFTIIVKNTGNVNLNMLNLHDNMSASNQLGSTFVGIIGNPVVGISNNVSGSAISPTINPNFDGRASNPKIITGTDGFLGLQDEYTVNFVARVNPRAANSPATLQNQATTTANSPSGRAVSDLSDDGDDNNGGQNGAPGDSGDTDEPTVLSAALLTIPEAELVLTKTATKKEAAIGDLIPYTILVQNQSNFVANNVTLVDDLPSGFKVDRSTIKVKTFDANDTLLNTNNATSSGVDPVSISALNIPVEANGYVQITYIAKVGTNIVSEKQCNTVSATVNASSNTATACVLINQRSVLDQSTLIGKVFHDRDGDGYQDDVRVSGLTVKSDYFGWNSLNLGILNGRVSILDDASKYRKVVRMPISKKNDFRVVTEQGTVIIVDNNGQIKTAHKGFKAKGLTAQDIRVTTRRTRGIPTQTPLKEMRVAAKVTDVLEITITNHGIQEEGIPGVRLATVEGLIIETDGNGRYHIPDVDGGRRSSGKNFIIKLDMATIPRGSRLTTENPRVLRLTSAALNKINFGVKLPTQEQAVPRENTVKPSVSKPVSNLGSKAVEVVLEDHFFVAGKTTIKDQSKEAVDQIVAVLKEHGSGILFVKVGKGHRSIALGKARANALRKQLHKRLGNMMGRVTVTTK